MLVDYEVIDMGCFDDYLDAAPCAKTTRGKGITTFLLHVAQCITFNQTIFFTATLIYKAWLKSFYSRLGFKVIKYVLTYPNFEKARKNFIMSQENSKHCRKKIGLQCYLTTPRRVTLIYDHQIDLNEN